LRDGAYITLNAEDPNVFSFLRKAPSGDSVVVALNMSGEPQKINFDLKSEGIDARINTVLKSFQMFREYRSEQTQHMERALILDDQLKGTALNEVTLPPFGTFIASVR
jgi:Alpha amylase, C-terminal all-beta domain